MCQDACEQFGTAVSIVPHPKGGSSGAPAPALVVSCVTLENPSLISYIRAGGTLTSLELHLMFTRRHTVSRREEVGATRVGGLRYLLVVPRRQYFFAGLWVCARRPKRMTRRFRVFGAKKILEIRAGSFCFYGTIIVHPFGTPR